jgi:hypothetical protein
VKSISREADSRRANQEIHNSCGNRSFITVFTKTRHCTLSWNHMNSVLIPSDPVSGFRTKILYIFLISPKRVVLRKMAPTVRVDLCLCYSIMHYFRPSIAVCSNIRSVSSCQRLDMSALTLLTNRVSTLAWYLLYFTLLYFTLNRRVKSMSVSKH